jgi:RimJ/RimL family protein N-acetyltransferase
MKIIEGRDVDLLYPFPQKELKRVFSWLRCYRTIPEIDSFPATAEALGEAMARVPTMQTFGIVDKNNFLQVRHEVPLIGMCTLDHDTLVNCNIHVTSNRKAWNSRLVDQAALLLVNYAFRYLPELTRVTLNCLSSNGPGRALARELRFRYEGCIRDAVVINNVPANMALNGLTRTDWNAFGLSEQVIEPVELVYKETGELVHG